MMESIPSNYSAEFWKRSRLKGYKKGAGRSYVNKVYLGKDSQLCYYPFSLFP